MHREFVCNFELILWYKKLAKDKVKDRASYVKTITVVIDFQLI